MKKEYKAPEVVPLGAASAETKNGQQPDADTLGGQDGTAFPPGGS